MKNLILLIIILSLFNACKSSKDVSRQQEDRTITEATKTTTTRLGDTVTYVVPKVVFKDTVIKVRNKQGSTQILKYDKEGTLTETQCLTSVVFLIEESNKTVIEAINNMNKHKETEVSGSIFIYFFIGLALFFSILFLVFFAVLKKYLKTLVPIAPI